TLAPVTPSTLYTGTTRIWRSDDGGDSWYALPTTTSGGSWNGSSVSAIAVAKTNENVLMASEGSGVYRSTDGRRTGAFVTTGLPGDSVNNLEIDPTNASVAWAALATTSGTGSICLTTNGGTSWAQTGVSSGLPSFAAQVVRVDPLDSTVIYAGTDVGVYRSTDSGRFWAKFGTGLPSSSANDLRILEDGSILRVATHGRGVWELQVPPSTNIPPTASIS